MTLFTDLIFVTNELEGFRMCRDNRTTASNSMTVLLCEKGYIDVYYHGEMIRINAGHMFVRIPDYKHELGPYQFSPDFEFKQVTIDATIYNQIMYDHMRVEPLWWQKQEYIKRNPIFLMDEVGIDFFHTYFHLLVLQMNALVTPFRIQILQLMARGVTMEMLNYMDRLAIIDEAEQNRQVTNHSDYTFHEFIKLLQEHPHEREVQWFAAQLKITPKYLSEICKQRSGKSAGEWIADVTVAEIKHYLRNTTLSVNEIVEVMHFPNASFFCQYMKKHTGLSPNKFRKLK